MMREFKLVLFSSLFLLFAGVSTAGQSVLLPDRMGNLNDYSAQLGSAQRQRLDFLVERLQNSGADVYLIINLLDPFSNSTRFAGALWEEWELANEHTLLLMFVREQNIWYFHWQASPDLRSVMNELVNDTKMFDGVLNLVSSRRISDAAVEAFEQLSLQFAGPEIEDVPLPEPDIAALETTRDPTDIEMAPTFETFTAESVPGQELAKNSTQWYIIGGIGGSLLFFLIIRGVFLMTCPACGAKLQTRESRVRSFATRRSSTRARKSGRVKTCPNCHYQRTPA